MIGSHLTIRVCQYTQAIQIDPGQKLEINGYSAFPLHMAKGQSNDQIDLYNNQMVLVSSLISKIHNTIPAKAVQF